MEPRHVEAKQVRVINEFYYYNYGLYRKYIENLRKSCLPKACLLPFSSVALPTFSLSQVPHRHRRQQSQQSFFSSRLYFLPTKKQACFKPIGTRYIAMGFNHLQECCGAASRLSTTLKAFNSVLPSFLESYHLNHQFIFKISITVRPHSNITSADEEAG